MNPKRLLAAALLSFSALHAANAAENRAMTIWKTPWCGCCHEWTEAMRQAGYAVKVNDLEDLTPIKKQAGVPAALEGCHTAMIDGYVLEGHVPLEAIDKLLSERPAIAGIATPGMPQGSLGMGDDPEARYDVYTFSRDADAAPAVYYRAGAE
ncbi:DUF411 domain-containing protein [Nitratireductor sp. ZSWI3]|uniref:DUF411 domain-containing protein n=1 Tax=Nitratireductor sp. ZSWI3 TaxID=2966359 RepID=UPI00214F8687|nr:DUF411 domain-containing protein [Nitratireductor sp. ZSWI3]MCR4267806.1 DUF411 domain-containing protein [Nitratireductor sp. ZSWI3]